MVPAAELDVAELERRNRLLIEGIGDFRDHQEPPSPIRKLVPLELRTCGSPGPGGAGFPLKAAAENVKPAVGAPGDARPAPQTDNRVRRSASRSTGSPGNQTSN